MNITVRLLLALLASLFSTAALSQLSISVELKGIQGELADNVRLFLSIEQKSGQHLLSEGRLYTLHKRAPQEITNALQPFGYYHPKIESQLQQSGPDQWLASYIVDPGPPLPIAELDFELIGEMKHDPEFLLLLDKIPLHQGAIFNHQHYESFKESLVQLASERGYFNARFSLHRAEIDLQRYEARIQLHYDGGTRYHFGEVQLQQDLLDPQFLQRYVPFKKGDPFTLSKLNELPQALNDSDYFRSVEVSAGEPQPDSSEIPITTTLIPRGQNRYSFGLGYGSDTGARTKFGWDIPRLNRSGHRFNTETNLSEIGYSLSFQYRVPLLNPRSDQMIYSAGVINEKTESSTSTIQTVGASLNRSRGNWRRSISLNYQQEEYVIADDRGLSTLLMPAINWRRTWGRNLINTIDGLRFDISLRGASKNLFSDTDFFQLQGGIKAITPLGKRDRLITHGRLGSTWTEEFEQLPSSIRFFAGGAQSVRGYAFQSLGPVDGNGNVVGGRHLMIGSVELEHKFDGKWSAAMFYDGGNAFDNLADKLERGAGFGVRWQSPIGPVRIDLASAISRSDDPWRLHINIGPDL
jgi:translocation and assembly module TamA